jgi:hypothetical protein
MKNVLFQKVHRATNLRGIHRELWPATLERARGVGITYSEKPKMGWTRCKGN